MRSPITMLAAVLELLHEARDLVEVVGEVGIRHHDVACRGRRRSRPGRRCRSPGAARARPSAPASGGQLGAAVLGAVVGHDDLAGDPVVVQHRLGARVTQSLDRLRLVETGDDDRDRGGPRWLAATWLPVSLVVLRSVLMLISASVAPPETPRRRGSRARRSAKRSCVRSALPACGSASSTTAFSRTPWAGPSVGTPTSPPPGRGRARGHLPDPSPVGPGSTPDVPGVRRGGGRPADGLYVPAAAGASCPRWCFGAGVLSHLLRHGRHYDVVHTASFPYFSLLAAALRAPVQALPPGRGLVRGVDPRLLAGVPRAGPEGGSAGWCSALCLGSASARSVSRGSTHGGCATRGLNGEATVLEGVYAGPLEPADPRPAGPAVVFAGRHIPEKRVPALVPAFALARRRCPELRCVIFGDGPDRQRGRAAGRPSTASGRGAVSPASSKRTRWRGAGTPCAWSCPPGARATG